MTAIQRLQTRAFEIIQSSKIEVYSFRSTLDVEQLFQFDRLVMLFKILTKICPEGLCDELVERSSISNYNTRNNTDLKVPKFNLAFSRKSFRYIGRKAWNGGIPAYIGGVDTLTQFTNELRKCFLS